MIRSYGPGKFDTILDSYVYALNLDGWEEESLGESEGFGYYGRLLLGQEAVDYVLKELKGAFKPTLTAEEKKVLSDSAGAIVSENDQGFVGVTYYKNKKVLDKAWARLEKDYEEFEEAAGDG